MRCDCGTQARLAVMDVPDPHVPRRSCYLLRGLERLRPTWDGSPLAASSAGCYGDRASTERYRVGDIRYRCCMPRSQVGLRISQEALTRIDTLANDYDTTRAATVRALLSEALASQPVVDATRRRLAGAL